MFFVCFLLCVFLYCYMACGRNKDCSLAIKILMNRLTTQNLMDRLAIPNLMDRLAIQNLPDRLAIPTFMDS